MDKDKYFLELSRRYQGADPEALLAIMCPLLIPIHSMNKDIHKVVGQSHWRASFTVKLDEVNRSVLQVGRTGKFVPHDYIEGGPWREVAKGRIIDVDYSKGLAIGEIYTGGSKSKLVSAVSELTDEDFLEIDQYGAAAKILSGLAEYYLAKHAEEAGYAVTRMPEDMARHLGAYANYDFRFEKNGVSKGIEAKSLWGTNTEYARLIHSTTTKPKGPEGQWTENQKANYYPTSSCKFQTQDIFAVSLFLRTGNIRDFAFARSISEDDSPYGLPKSSKFPDHVHQNPKCEIGDGKWFATIDEVWELD